MERFEYLNDQWKINRTKENFDELSNYFLLTNNLVSDYRIHVSFLLNHRPSNSIHPTISPLKFLSPLLYIYPTQLFFLRIPFSFFIYPLSSPFVEPSRSFLFPLVSLSGETSGSTERCLPLGDPPLPPLSSLLPRLRPESVGRNCAPGEGGFLSIAGCSFTFFIRPVTLDPL